MKGKFIKPEDQERADKLFELLQKQKCEHKESKEERIVLGILKWTLLYPAMVAVIGSIYFGIYNRFFIEDRFYVPITDNRPVETLKLSDTIRVERDTVKDTIYSTVIQIDTVKLNNYMLD